MLEVTLMMLIAAAVFFILRTLFKSDELECMAVIMCVVALACVLQDESLADYLMMFIIPLFYGALMSILGLTHWGDRS